MPSPTPDVVAAHADYMPLWIALIGVVGTLLGSVVTPLLRDLVQQKRDREQNRQRAIREELAEYVTAVSARLNIALAEIGSPDSADLVLSGARAHADVLLSISRLGLLVGHEDLPVLATMTDVVDSDDPRTISKCLDAAMTLLSAWHRGELTSQDVLDQYVQKTGEAGDTHEEQPAVSVEES